MRHIIGSVVGVGFIVFSIVYVWQGLDENTKDYFFYTLLAVTVIREIYRGIKEGHKTDS